MSVVDTIKSFRRVLVVDDEPALRKSTGVMLLRMGYLVSTSHSTDAAWKAVETQPASFDVAVLDASMSGMTMMDLAQKLFLINPGIVVIICSGYPVDVTALEATAPGRVVYLPKPFTQVALVETIERMIMSKGISVAAGTI